MNDQTAVLGVAQRVLVFMLLHAIWPGCTATLTPVVVGVVLGQVQAAQALQPVDVGFGHWPALVVVGYCERRV